MYGIQPDPASTWTQVSAGKRSWTPELMISGRSVIMLAAPTLARPVRSSPRAPFGRGFWIWRMTRTWKWTGTPSACAASQNGSSSGRLAEARLGAEVPLVRLGEGDARPAHVLVLASRRGVDADRRRRDVGAELPRLAAVAVGHDLRRLVVELARQVLLPDVRWLEDVRVGRDEMVLARHAGFLRPLSYEQTFVHFKRPEPWGAVRLTSRKTPC